LRPLIWLLIAHFTPALPLAGGVQPSAASLAYLGLDPSNPPFLDAREALRLRTASASGSTVPLSWGHRHQARYLPRFPSNSRSRMITNRGELT